MPQLNVQNSPSDSDAGDRDSSIIRFIRQFTDWRFKAPLGPDDYFWRSEQLKAAISASVTSGSVVFTPPANYNCLIFGIEGLLAFNNATGEPVQIAGIGNPGVLERMALKAMNVRLDLQNVGRTQKIFGTASKPLIDIYEAIGGKKFDMRGIPYALPDGEQLQLDISVADTTSGASGVIGASTDVGVSLECLYVRTHP